MSSKTTLPLLARLTGGRIWRTLLKQDGKLMFSQALVIFLSNGLLKASNAVLFIFAVRWLGREPAGQLSTATSFVAISLNIALFGLDEILAREAARQQDHARLFANLLTARIALVGTSLVLFDLFLIVSGLYTPELTLLILLLSLGQIGDGIMLLCQALFVSQRQVQLVLLTAVMVSGLRMGVGLPVMAGRGELLPLALLFVATSTAGGVWALRLAQRQLLQASWGQLLGRVDGREIINRLRRSTSFFWIGLFVMIEMQIDVILISVLKSPSEVTSYATAQTVLLAAWLMPQAYRSVIYPALARAKAGSADQFKRLLRTTIGSAVGLGILASGGVIVLAPMLIGVLYPAEYSASTLVLQLLALTLFFAFASAPSSRAMLTLNREALAAVFLGVTMAVNVLANLLLIPPYGPLGAAIARVVADGLFCGMTYGFLLLAGAKRPG